MASKINADEFVDREGEGKPTLPKGVVLSGVTTITTAVVAENEVANSTGINVGIITSTHFAGNLTGDVNAGIVTVSSQTVIGSAVTISASGIDIGAGVITATSYAGSGANLTGIGATIMVWEYNPDPYDTAVTFASGIGITFNQKIKAGSGNITLREDSASGTVVENFGIGSSVTITNNSLTIDPTSDLSESQVYYLELPSGVITNMAGESYVGTAYTFTSLAYTRKLFGWGYNATGQLAQNNHNDGYSSPIQITGTDWGYVEGKTSVGSGGVASIKTNGELWTWGKNTGGQLGQGDRTEYSSPVQVPGTWSYVTRGYTWTSAINTDGELWMWGGNGSGTLGQNQPDALERSSPVQVPGTTWSKVFNSQASTTAIKTDGTLWAWGKNTSGMLGQNQAPGTLGAYSSPIQIGSGTDWSTIGMFSNGWHGIKTDGTMWGCGRNDNGAVGDSTKTDRSSPVQIPGTTWSVVRGGYYAHAAALKTDGTLWSWGYNQHGNLGLNNRTEYESPVQVPGTTWSKLTAGDQNCAAIKTDGTLWTWGLNTRADLGQNNTTKYSSPVQIPGTDWAEVFGGVQTNGHYVAIQQTT